MAGTGPQNPPPPPPPSECHPSNIPAQPAASNAAGSRQRGSFVRGVLRHLRHVGGEMVSVALGKQVEEPRDASESPSPGDPASPGGSGLEKRLSVLHQVAERLRGAADDYIAAKLDEMEARVDAKLDHIEQRIDHKITNLHEHLAEMRDRELRHRLRLLKITLIFTVLVALLSLGYKWVSQLWT